VKLAFALAATVMFLSGTAFAAPGEAPYRATGSAPEWRLTIGDGLIRYVGDNGRTRITTRAPKPRISFAGEIYRARGIGINIVHARCTARDAAVYRDRVSVTVRGRTVQGCGGDIVDRPERPVPLPVAARHGPGVPALDDSAWTISSVDGIPAATARPTSIRFSNGRVEGNAGCNSFGGDYQQRGIMLQASHIISTRMACPGQGMQIEGKVFHILEGPAQVSFRSGETLVISTDGSSMTLSRERWAR